MRVICAVFLVTSALSFAGIAIADEQERTAVVEDTAGQSTEVTDLYLSAAVENYRYSIISPPGGCLVVDTGTFEICIPFGYVVSVVQTDGLSSVKYVLKGQEFTAKGKLGTGSLQGKSDFGGFSISTANIRRIDIKSPPAPGEGYEVSGSPVPATLTLLDDSMVPVLRLHCFFRYFSTEGYIMGGEWKTITTETIEFMRGESKTSVAMRDIAKVDFGANDTVSVTLKNGKSTTGTLAQDYVAAGFCGTFEKGYFFIDKKRIKSIEFFGGAK